MGVEVKYKFQTDTNTNTKKSQMQWWTVGDTKVGKRVEDIEIQSALTYFDSIMHIPISGAIPIFFKWWYEMRFWIKRNTKTYLSFSSPGRRLWSPAAADWCLRATCNWGQIYFDVGFWFKKYILMWDFDPKHWVAPQIYFWVFAAIYQNNLIV